MPHANPIDARVRVFNVSGSKLPELFLSGHSEGCWGGNSSRGNCYIGWRKSMANDVVIWHALRLQMLSEEQHMYLVKGKTNIYRGKWRIVLWPKWIRSDIQLRVVSSSPSRRVMATDTFVALICVLFSNTLGGGRRQRGKNECKQIRDN